MPTRPKKILVIGDLILDVIHRGVHIGQSLAHSRTPVAKKHSVAYLWGGAGFLVRNMLALGAEVRFVSLIGSDGFSAAAAAFEHPRLHKRFMRVTDKPTTVKERFWVGDRKLLSWHHLDNTPLSRARERELLQMIRAQLPKIDKVVVADYCHGLLSARLGSRIVHECARRKIPLYVDSQVAYDNTCTHRWYAGAGVFCLNAKEAKSIDQRFSARSLRSSLARLQRILRSPNIIVKLGDRGSAALFEERFIQTRAHSVTERDPSGAGDAFLAALSMGSTPPSESDLIDANVWAALSTTRIGTEIPSVAAFRRLVRRKTS